MQGVPIVATAPRRAAARVSIAAKSAAPECRARGTASSRPGGPGRRPARAGLGNTGRALGSATARDSAGTFSKSKVATSIFEANSPSAGFIAVVADHHRRELACAGVGDVVHHQEAQAQRRAGKREHAGQLPASEDTDRGTRAPSFARVVVGEHVVGLAGAEACSSACADRRMLVRQHRGGEQGRVGGACVADGEGRHRECRPASARSTAANPCR